MLAPVNLILLLLVCRLAHLAATTGADDFAIDHDSNHNNNNYNNNTNVDLLFGVQGHPSCRCLRDFEDSPVHPDDNLPALQARLGPRFNVSIYGLGCGAHDLVTTTCYPPTDCSRQFPRPASECDQTWCRRAWCFVDPLQCTLLHKRSVFLSHTLRYYSYAACGQMDYFTNENRIATLEGQTLRVGINSNTGGWGGAYSDTKQHFVPPMERWDGLMVDFIKHAAYTGDFTIQIADPPLDLRNRSDAFFGSTSDFDFCVYLTALGYFDFCIAEYTITDIRASSADFMVMDTSGIYLIGTLADQVNDVRSSWRSFRDSTWKAFAPLSASAWLFILFFVMPVFAVLTVVHEYGQRGSTLPTEEKVVVSDAETGKHELHMRPIPLYKTCFESLYQLFLASFVWAWTMPVVTAGSKLNLLGISFFTLATLAAYTANLAAIFGQTREAVSVSNLEEAVQRKLRFCMERKRMETVTNRLSLLDKSMFVLDPDDGLPGFLQKRSYVFEKVDPVRANTDATYCHAALAPLDDLEVLHADAQACDLVPIGDPILSLLSGFPIAERISPALKTLVYKMRIDGISDLSKRAGRPISKCPVVESGEGTALTITSLSGIWIVTFLFCWVGLLISHIIPFFVNLYFPEYAAQQRRIRPVIKRDQNALPIEVFQPVDDDELVTRSLEQVSLHRRQENTFIRLSTSQPKRILASSTSNLESMDFDKDDDDDASEDESSFGRDNSTDHQRLQSKPGARIPTGEKEDAGKTNTNHSSTSNNNTQQEQAMEQLEVPRNPNDSDDDSTCSEDFSHFENKLRQRLGGVAVSK